MRRKKNVKSMKKTRGRRRRFKPTRREREELRKKVEFCKRQPNVKVMDIGNFFTKVQKEMFDNQLKAVLQMLADLSTKKQHGRPWEWY